MKCPYKNPTGYCCHNAIQIGERQKQFCKYKDEKDCPHFKAWEKEKYEM